MANVGMMGSWWGRVGFGIIAIIFGILIILYPGISVTVFLYLFGIFLLISGLILIASGIRGPAGAHRWLRIGEGVVELIIAAAAFLSPSLTAVAVVVLVGIFAIITGLIQLASATVLRRSTEAELGTRSTGFLAISGLFSLIIGLILVFFPVGGILAIVWLIGLFAIVLGLFNIATGFRVRASPQRTTTRR